MIEFAFHFSMYSFLAFGVVFLVAIWLSATCCAIEFLFRVIDKTNHRK